MSTRADYTDEEWRQLSTAPMEFATTVVLGGGSGPFAAVKEATAAARGYAEELKDPDAVPLVREIAAHHKELRHELKEQQEAEGGKPHSAGEAKDRALELARTVSATLDAKTSPDEAAAYKQWALSVAERTAKAAKEGGFLGIGGPKEHVSGDEQKLLDDLAAALGVERAEP